MNVRSILISRKRTVSLIRVGIFSFSRFFDLGIYFTHKQKEEQMTFQRSK